MAPVETGMSPLGDSSEYDCGQCAARGDRDAAFELACPECPGHPAGEFDPMGQTVYCDGSCQQTEKP